MTNVPCPKCDGTKGGVGLVEHKTHGPSGPTEGGPGFCRCAACGGTGAVTAAEAAVLSAYDGSAFRTARRAAGKTLLDCAKLAGVSLVDWSNVECGDNRHADVLARCQRALALLRSV